MNYGRLRVGDVLEQAARLYGITEKELLGSGKQHVLCKQRQAAMGAARLLGFSFPMIGAAFNRDHSTVIHAARVAAADPLMAEDAREIALAVCEQHASTGCPKEVPPVAQQAGVGRVDA